MTAITILYYILWFRHKHAEMYINKFPGELYVCLHFKIFRLPNIRVLYSMIIAV